MLLDYVNQKMKEAGIDNYQVETQLVTVRGKRHLKVGDSADFHFTVNFYSSTAISGQVVGTNDAFALSPEVVQSQVAKIKAFRGVIDIYNNGTQPLHVEFLRVSPV